MKRRTYIGGIGSVLTAFASLGCYGLASNRENSSEGDGASNTNSDQNGSQNASDGSGNSTGSEKSTNSNESGESKESNESGESDTSPEKPTENESTADYDVRKEQKAARAEDVPKSHIDISVTKKKQTKDGIMVKGKVKNMTSNPITFVDVDVTFEDSSESYLHSEVTRVRTIGPTDSEEFKVEAYYQQIPGEVGNISISIAGSGRVPEEAS